MIIYISGKVTDLCEVATEKRFQDAEDCILGLGHIAYNPVKEINFLIKEGQISKDDRGAIMRYLISELALHCDAIYMLDGWNDSKGAIQERAIAQIMGFTILYQSNNDLNNLEKMIP